MVCPDVKIVEDVIYRRMVVDRIYTAWYKPCTVSTSVDDLGINLIMKGDRVELSVYSMEYRCEVYLDNTTYYFLISMKDVDACKPVIDKAVSDINKVFSTLNGLFREVVNTYVSKVPEKYISDVKDITAIEKGFLAYIHDICKEISVEMNSRDAKASVGNVSIAIYYWEKIRDYAVDIYVDNMKAIHIRKNGAYWTKKFKAAEEYVFNRLLKAKPIIENIEDVIYKLANI